MNPTPAEVKEALYLSWRHWQRMHSWAKMQNPNSFVSRSAMNGSLGELWCGDDCALCLAFNIDLWSYDCVHCPLKSCSKGSLWSIVAYSETWGQFVERSAEMVHRLHVLYIEQEC